MHNLAVTNEQAVALWKPGVLMWGAIAVAAGLISSVFGDGIRELLDLWSTKEEYSHAFLIPLISLFLCWQKKNEISAVPWNGSWIGVIVCAFGVGIFFAGALSTIYAVIHYALIVTIAGTAISLTGKAALRYLWVPMLFLIFMIPLPVFLYRIVSTTLQLISSELGVLFIRSFGISVFLEGNVIDLGSYKLQVVEACNGLRYLFPLASFGFLCAYLYRGPFLHRTVIFLSTIPITVLMNSFRIGVIGYTVDNWGQEMAEGFLHEFEGWAIFMVCLAVLFVEIALLTRMQRPRVGFADAFFVEMPGPMPVGREIRIRLLPKQFVVSLLVLAAGAAISLSIVKREEIIPSRRDFIDFPVEIGDWRGQRDTIDQVYLDILKLTDYVMVNYVRTDKRSLVSFYTAYYSSQRAGESAHSPRSCIPGGGWKIESLSQFNLSTGNGHSHRANRVQIAMGENKQLVYYWFQQRGRFITNEYLVKWYLFWDALTQNRSDGALVRLTTPVLPNENWEAGDRRLQEFVGALGDRLSQFVPD